MKEGKTMDLPINVNVFCSDDRGGVSTYVILNPTTEQATHLVVKEKEFPHTERLVPIDLISETTPHQIQLRCTKHQLAKMKQFIETEFVRRETPSYMDPFMWWPYAIPESEIVTVEHERIPAGELAVHRGTRVEATDGHAGRVDEFLIDPTNEHITHLVLREGHLWGQKDVTIPISAIDHIEDDTVYLKFNKRSIEDLPTIPIRR
jgi:sporulation protein YlmC with PRC-barrel domain